MSMDLPGICHAHFKAPPETCHALLPTDVKNIHQEGHQSDGNRNEYTLNPIQYLTAFLVDKFDCPSYLMSLANKEFQFILAQASIPYFKVKFCIVFP